MIVKESDIRKKIRRLLSEKFIFYHDKRIKQIDDINEDSVNGCVVFDLTSKPVASNILHRLTKDADSSYEAWKVVFEKIFILNMLGVIDRNTSHSPSIFYDIEWNSVRYSLKSTLGSKRSPGDFQTKAYGRNPTFTKEFIEKCKGSPNRYGIIVATKIENDLIWQRVGQTQLGSEIYKKWEVIDGQQSNEPLQTALQLNEKSGRNPSRRTNEEIKSAIVDGRNPQYVITHFFGEGYTDVLKVKLAPPIDFAGEELNPLLNSVYSKIDELVYTIERNKSLNDPQIKKIEADIGALIQFISASMTEQVSS